MLEPVTNPVLIFAIAMAIFLIAPIIMRKLRIPGIIGLIFAGVIVGPNGIGILDRDPTIVLLGTVGLLYIIFIAGLEIDLEGFKKYRKRSLTFGFLSFNLPFILGCIAILYYGYPLAAAILLGSLLGSHTLLAYPIASRLGVAKNKSVTMAVGGSIITDTLALLILAVVAGSTQDALTVEFWLTLLLSMAIYVAAIFLIIPIIAKFFFRSYGSEGTLEFVFVMTVLFVSAYFATVAGLEPIIGAFLAGLALNRFIFEQSPLMNRIKFIGNAIFIPFFLLSVGMLMDLRVLFLDPNAWIIASLVITLVIAGKFGAAWITKKIYRYSNEELWLMFGLTIPQAAATLAATLVGFDLGLFDKATVNAVIVMILVTCMIGPYLVEKYARRLVLKESQMPYEPTNAPQRVMIPIANPHTLESLMDLAFIVRESTSESLYTLSVARSSDEDSSSQVVEAEKLLGHAVQYAAGAEVPIHMLTRVDPNIATGIVRAIEDTRITNVVIGWNGKLSTPQKIFGGVLDQLLERTSQMVLVSKLEQPLNTTKRIVILIPSGFDHKIGFYEPIKVAKRMANQIGATIAVYVMKDEVQPYQKGFQKVKPDAQVTITKLESWHEWNEEYLPKLKKDDIVIVFSARRGTIAWHPQLELLPRVLANATSKSFIMVYPTEENKVSSRGTRGLDVPKTFLSNKSYD
ncbi:cation:proton antiporter [Bacillus sp. JCM 19034]|uniref:cation:proton antiporter n=1 Tax=Bacillus sp. JCM 19034 TaxID=1481928 RepID=UPI0007816ACD|nr:cation:proton antiporter [Bacillus sp. JCM 19034]